ncbi:efflux RND transporter periplasmic adaptor subunit [Sulfurimonas sp.]|uniref:efflux RND transporter periplasmic adaptor subunit n=1 Tax=Sulfurimonas sp. TaxID=2022749 RepID=UPI0025E6565F|nr:efflux RND transporter periplasmic adaptor subunit [Sulfurimonas sp.]MDD5156860.1 efflux RND transporter periplasmic adaptor subunit [Sulfurimonas sp.]
MKNASVAKWMLVVIITILGGFGYWWFMIYKAPIKERFKQESIERGDVLQTASANGTLNPVVLVNVGTQVSGTVKELKVDFNDHVKKGEVMATLDPSLFNAQIAQSSANVANAQSSVALARANKNRSHELFEKEYISRQDYEHTLQTLESAEASLALAKAQMQRDLTNKNYSIIKSPVSGVVVDRQIDVGQTVAASFQTPTLFKIAQDLRKMQIDANFAEADIGQIKVGQDVTFNVDAFSNRTFKGVVKQIRLNATITSNVVTYDIVVSVDNPQQILFPGMTAYVTVIENRRTNVLLVSNAALRYDPVPNKKIGKKQNGLADATKRHVYILENAQPKKINISVGITDGKYTEVTDGALKAGDKVIVGENKDDSAKDNKNKSSLRLF